MKSKLFGALLLALSVGATGKLAMAQDKAADVQVPQAQYAVFHPAQTNAALQMTAWRDRDGDRCDGDHDRDDRNCRYDRDRDDRYRNNGYWGNNNNGYYGNVRNQNGWYDRNGYWHSNTSTYGNNGYWGNGNGYYDRNGYWHSR